MVKKILTMCILGCALVCLQFAGLNFMSSMTEAYAETGGQDDSDTPPLDPATLTEDAEESSDEGDGVDEEQETDEATESDSENDSDSEDPEGEEGEN